MLDGFERFRDWVDHWTGTARETLADWAEHAGQIGSATIIEVKRQLPTVAALGVMVGCGTALAETASRFSEAGVFGELTWTSHDQRADAPPASPSRAYSEPAAITVQDRESPRPPQSSALPRPQPEPDLPDVDRALVALDAQRGPNEALFARVATSGSSLTVRTSPGGAEISSLPPKHRVEICTVEGDWAQINYDARRAWVHAGYLQVEANVRSLIKSPVCADA
jgi:hypothetical protein